VSPSARAKIWDHSTNTVLDLGNFDTEEDAALAYLKEHLRLKLLAAASTPEHAKIPSDTFSGVFHMGYTWTAETTINGVVRFVLFVVFRYSFIYK
jgi:hypothetical protein